MEVIGWVLGGTWGVLLRRNGVFFWGNKNVKLDTDFHRVVVLPFSILFSVILTHTSLELEADMWKRKDTTCRFLGFAHKDQLQWVSYSYPGMLGDAPILIITASLQVASLRFKLLCLVKLSKWIAHNTLTCPVHLIWELSYCPSPYPCRSHSLHSGLNYFCSNFFSSDSPFSGFSLLLLTLLTPSGVIVVKRISWLIIW